MTILSTTVRRWREGHSKLTTLTSWLGWPAGARRAAEPFGTSTGISLYQLLRHGHLAPLKVFSGVPSGAN